ncbi:MAG TPA: NAD(P)-dependent oxidoreductase [Acidimicrobiia bacterium]|jgi:nucleoside-diphosphate-sugar epimerase|nr:NAD(P)-dependent oxidoreductase [Acidimicrobiia bacterium]
MRIFLAGATGAIGQRLVPLLIDAGHEVVGSTRTPAKVDGLRLAGATPVVLDGSDGDAVRRAVHEAEPEVVVHQMTALSGDLDLRRFAESFAETNRLRTETTDWLIEAAVGAGARRFIAQSFAGWPNEQSGGPVKTEEDPLNTDPPKQVRDTLGAILHLEDVTTGTPGIEGLALRYGGFYGPGNALGKGGAMLEAVAKRQVPIVGGGTGVWSFLHIDDAARATALAVDRGAPGIYNIVDDEPAAVSEWLPYLAEILGTKRPRRVPVWLARLLVGEPLVSMMTKIRGSSNAKAKRELGWKLDYPTWRVGFRDGL